MRLVDELRILGNGLIAERFYLLCRVEGGKGTIYLGSRFGVYKLAAFRRYRGVSGLTRRVSRSLLH